jgi:hypothetical protein
MTEPSEEVELRPTQRRNNLDDFDRPPHAASNRH